MLLAAVALASWTTSASALEIVAEPDDFAEGTDLRDVFRGATLSVLGKPTAVVRSLDSEFNEGPTAGRNIASTGTKVFGHTVTGSTINEEDFFRVWTEGTSVNPSTILRVDFAYPTDYVAIDMIANDDDEFTLQAFSSDGTLLESVNLGVFRNTFKTFSVTRELADVSYVLAAGVPGEGGPLDNLQYNYCGPDSNVVDGCRLPTIPATIGINPDRNRRCLNQHPVVVYGGDGFDVADINVGTLRFDPNEGETPPEPLCTTEYVNDDEYLDLRCKFVPGTAEARLSGELMDGTSFEGSDAICAAQ